MVEADLILLGLSFFMVATLYSITGHGGASGYIAVMVLLGLSPQEIKPLALGLNVVVASIATILFYRAGHFKGETFWPFVAGSIPLAMLGGYLDLPIHWFNLAMGGVLLLSAFRLAIRDNGEEGLRRPALGVAVISGGCIGLVSGLIGIGGGVLLTPLLLISGWANAKQAAAVSAPFILLNSISGLIGIGMHSSQSIPEHLVLASAFVLVGGVLGSFLGSRTLPMRMIPKVLSAVLVIAGLKLFYV